MKRFTLLMALTILSISIFAQQKQYSKAKVFVNKSQLAQLATAGIDVSEGFLKKDAFLESDFSQDELLKIQELGLDYEILIEDVAKYYVDRNIGKSTDINDYKGISEWEVPENFEFGSMSGHATFEEIVAHLDNMSTLYPNLITVKESIGQSIEERNIWMVKISDNPNTNETEPEVLYNSLHHAREPAGAMTLIFYMYYLLENYDTDPFVQMLVNDFEMFFIPVVNPDGYVYNETIAPNGGGMWRKNRKDNGVPGCMGVDLNRNYGYQWGFNNIGSSPDPCEETYRGESAFSEPETMAMRDFVESHDFKTALNYHTYGNLLLFPWGYTEELCPDYPIFDLYGALMTQVNNYTYGPTITAINYATNGDANDWLYGEDSTKNKIYGFIPELGSNSDGFWCAIDRIIPIAQENMIQNILAALFAGNYADVKETSPTLYSETSGEITFDITRLGLEDGGGYFVGLEAISEEITAIGDANYFSDMEILETQSGSFPFGLNPAITSGTQFQFLLSVNNGSYISYDTITKVFGEATVLFEDDCNTFDNWVSPYWDITTSNSFSPPASITDSPEGNYPNSHMSVAILNDEIDLSEAAYAILQFQAMWEIEEGYDYVQLQISTGGYDWEPLEGIYTIMGNGYQAQGEPVYDGFQSEWVQEEINLIEYIGNSVSFRFLIKSDGSVTEDGFYFDDFELSIVQQGTTGTNETIKDVESLYISNPVPNPAKDKVYFTIGIPDESKRIKFLCYNASGQQVYTTQISSNQSNVVIDVNNWNPGIYYYKIQRDGKESETKKLVIIK